MPTVTTVPLIILIVFLWYRTKGNILSIVLFTSIFEAASAINFGSLGVSPPLFALVFCLGFKVLRGHSPFHFVYGINRLGLYLLIIFSVYAVCTGIAYPILFQGAPVMHGAGIISLSWGVSNFAQICYLLASVLIYFLTISSTRQEIQDAVDWYVRGCIVAALFAVYQLANAVMHIPYPNAILYSNPSHVIYHAYMINGMWRLNSTFPEASEFSTFVTVGIGLLGWTVMTRPLRPVRTACLILMLVSLLMTESSLGYVCLIFILLVGGVLYTWSSFSKRGISASKLMSLFVVLVVLIGALTVNKTVGETANKLITSTLLDKKNSQSYRERTETHDAALETLKHTYYMGAGWGSIRASGLVYVLLGNTGILGLTVFFAFYVSLFLPLFRRNIVTYQIVQSDLFEQSLFATTVMLVGLSVAGAEPVQPILWLLFGVATAGRSPESITPLSLASSRIPDFLRLRRLTSIPQ